MSYQLSICASFHAEHALLLKGEREPLHAHTWQVTATVSGPSLDEDGLLCDFHDLETLLQRIVAPFDHGNLNRIPPFDAHNPSAELVARHIAQQMAHQLPQGISLESVSVTEAPGCTATYRPA
ncbi:MAG: 6-carboxytetrahydropterin synthase [Planctomycetes bacterium]|nr:6-carboxytetrahydropterin synthase [Planctomycetota bacterium]NOG54874.1 6-carboxytetrahydropterin synthase [Planctomycetota bacterium]